MLVLCAAVPAAHAQDTLKVAAGQRGNWDTTIAEVGQRAGIFKKHGLDARDPVDAGRRRDAAGGDLGQRRHRRRARASWACCPRTRRARPCASSARETTGASDLYWYVPANSPIKSLKDTDGKTIAYSTNGSSTHGIVTAFMKQYDLKAKPTATGGPAPTLTQVMSGQIDVGWSAPPFGLQQLDEGKIRDHRHGQRRRGVQGPDGAPADHERADAAESQGGRSTVS